MYELTDIEIDQVAGGNVVANGNAQAPVIINIINGVPVISTSPFFATGVNATGVNAAGSVAGRFVPGPAAAGGFALP